MFSLELQKFDIIIDDMYAWLEDTWYIGGEKKNSKGNDT